MTRYRPSRQSSSDFAQKMNEVKRFCEENKIDHSMSSDSYYFTINGQKYRVSNHSVEASDKGMYDQRTGQKIRDSYHKGGRESDVKYIHAGKSRIIDIYNDLKNGYELDGKGKRTGKTLKVEAKKTKGSTKPLESTADENLKTRDGELFYKGDSLVGIHPLKKEWLSQIEDMYKDADNGKDLRTKRIPLKTKDGKEADGYLSYENMGKNLYITFPGSKFAAKFSKETLKNAKDLSGANEKTGDGKWVTIAGHHVFIPTGSGNKKNLKLSSKPIASGTLKSAIAEKYKK